jgi:hypothetical protein
VILGGFMIKTLNAVLFLLIMSFIISCAKTENYIENCENIKCSKDAFCRTVNSIPVCVCNEGFNGDGFECLEISDFSWRRTIGSLNNDQGTIISHDEENNIYVAGSFQGDVDFDSSEGVDIHSSGYICVAREACSQCRTNEMCNYDTLECTCKDGYHLEDESVEAKCIIDICDENCNENEFCNDNKCACKDGFHKDINSNCVQDFTCPISCGLNGKCENGVCVCEQGYKNKYFNNSFLTKLTPNGTYLWTKTIFSLNDNKIIDLELKNEIIYLLGTFIGNIDFDPSDGFDIKQGNENKESTFLQQLTNNGSYIRTIILEANAPKSVVVNSNDTLYVTGSFMGKVDFDPGITGDFFESVNNSYDIFLTKLKTDGSYLWTKVIGGENWDSTESITLDSFGDVYIAGGFNSVVDFNPTDGIDEKISNGMTDIFISKFSFSGAYLWTKTLGSTNYDTIEDLIVDSNDDVLVIGSFSDTLEISEFEGYDSHGLADIFVSKLNKNGDFLWTKVFGGPQWEINGSIAVDNTNNVYITGGFMESITFDDNIDRMSLGGYDIFISKLASNGEYIWGKTIGGDNDENGESISIDNNNNILITGGFWENIILETTSESFLSKGNTDIFIFKIK